MKTATKARIGLVACLSIIGILVGFFNFGAEPELNKSVQGISFTLESAIAEEQGQIEYKNTIRDQLDKNDYSGAVVTCDSALKDYPNDADFWYFNGFALAETKQFDKAMEAYKKGISIHVDKNIRIDYKTEEVIKHFLNGNANRKENPDLAINEYLICQNLEPSSPWGFYTAAVSYLWDKNNPGKAIEYTKKALGVKPDFILALHLMGNGYFNKGDWKEASFYFNLVLSIDTNYILKDSVLDDLNECSKHLK